MFCVSALFFFSFSTWSLVFSSFFFMWRNWFGRHHSTIWNMVPACLMWLVWQERNTRTFEDKERTLDHLKSLLFGTLFLWAHIWGCTNCIFLFDFLASSSFSSWFFCIYFLFRVFTIVSMMFNFFNIKSYYLSKKNLAESPCLFEIFSCFLLEFLGLCFGLIGLHYCAWHFCFFQGQGDQLFAL